jgi:hypothetical protein
MNENETDEAQMRIRCLPGSFAPEKLGTGRLLSRLAKLLSILFLGSSVALTGCALSDRVDNRNFAVTDYSPTPNEIQLAQQRAQRYWRKNSTRFKNPTRYLAVATTSVLPGDIVQNIYPELISSETTGSFFSQSENTPLNATCIMIYDTSANRFVSNSGYISVDLPPRGSVARWESYMARYMGW